MKAIPNMLPDLPKWARPKIDPKRVAQWANAQAEWDEWSSDTKERMYPRILAVQRNNLIEALDALRAEVEATYAAAIAPWQR